MNAADLTALWREITRTARPGARVIFRTAADERLLPGRVPDEILEPLALRRGGEPRLRPPGPLVDLRRLPPLRAEGRLSMSDAAALMDEMYRHQRHIYDLTRKYYLIGRDEAIARLAPAARRFRARDRLRHRPQPDQGGAAYPSARFFGLDVSRAMLDTAEAAIRRAGLASESRSPRATRRLRSEVAVRPACLRPRDHLLRALDDPALAEAMAGRSTSLRRAARCTLSISATAPACRGCSRRAYAAGSPPST